MSTELYMFENNLRRRSSGSGSTSKISCVIHNGRVLSGKSSILKNYGGLGYRYYNQLGHELDKIYQVDVTRSHTETKGSVRGRSIRLALEMIDRGVGENDIIVICSRNNADQVIVLLATLFLGAIVAPLDPEYSNREKHKLLKKLKPKMCFGDMRTVTHLERILSSLNFNTEVFNFTPESSGISQFTKLFCHKEDEVFRPVIIEDTKRTVAFILPTQGTTDTPKLVCISHDNICLQCLIFEELLVFPKRIISFFPLSWIVQTILTCICLESMTTLILPGTFTEKTACKIIHDFDISCAVLGTDVAMKLATSVAIKDYNVKCLKCVMVGIVDTSKYDITTLKKMMPDVTFLPLYCIVETGCIAATYVKDYSVTVSKPPDVVGTLTLNCKIKVVDIQNFEICGPNKYGEIYFNGDGLMLGYFKDMERTLKSMDRGYFKTGDLGKYDEDGWLYISGRIEDLIRFDSWSLVPTDIEDIVLSNPHIKDAVVIGNERQVIVFAKNNPESPLTNEDLYKFLTEKLSRKYWPTKVVMLDHFPRTTIGSVKKRSLRNEYLYPNIQYSSSIIITARKTNNLES